MCVSCDSRPQLSRFGNRHQFLKGFAATNAVATGLNLFAPRPASAQSVEMPAGTGGAGRRYVIRGGSVMSIDPEVGDLVKADVLVEGKRISAIAANIDAGDAAVIDATGWIVMPGFIDTHHHQFETALRSFLADGVLIKDGTPNGEINYYEYVLLKIAPVYRPEDVYISERFGSLSQLDDGVTTVLDVSQIHDTPEHSDAAVKGIMDSGRRTAFGFSRNAIFAVAQIKPDLFRSN